jgi:hypothetical protein
MSAPAGTTMTYGTDMSSASMFAQFFRWTTVEEIAHDTD